MTSQPPRRISVGDKVQATEKSYPPAQAALAVQACGKVIAVDDDRVTFVADHEYDMSYYPGHEDYDWDIEPREVTVPVDQITYHWPLSGADVIGASSTPRDRTRTTDLGDGTGPSRTGALQGALVTRLEAAYVSVPVKLPWLPDALHDSGLVWERVADPHLSVFTADRIVDRLVAAGWAPADAVARLERASEFARGWPVRVERFTEIRVARRDERRTVIVLAAARGLDTLYARLSDAVGVALPPPPAHVTLYTAPGGKGIGICDEADLHQLTRPAAPPLAALIASRLTGAT